MISEAVILMLIFDAVLAIIAVYSKSAAVMLVSSIAEWLTAIRLFDDLGGEAIPSVMLIGVGLVQYFVVANKW